MLELPEAAVPGWEGRMLLPEASGDELPVGPVQALVFPMAVPASRRSARSGRVPDRGDRRE
jgi:hypothetical protein